MTLTTKPFDPALYLDSPAAIATYLEEAFEIGDPAFIADALGIVARESGLGARAFTKRCAQTGILS